MTVPCPVAGLADALEGRDSLGYAAIEQSVFGRFCGQLADRRQPQIDGSRPRCAIHRNSAAQVLALEPTAVVAISKGALFK
jgi:hypothetical protein